MHAAGLTEAAIEAIAERFTVKSAPVTPAEDVEEWPDLGAPSNTGSDAQAGAGQHSLIMLQNIYIAFMVTRCQDILRAIKQPTLVPKMFYVGSVT